METHYRPDVKMLKKLFFIILLALALTAGVKIYLQHIKTLKTLGLDSLRQELRNLDVRNNEGVIRSWGFAHLFDSKKERLGPDRILEIAQYTPDLYDSMFEDASKRALEMAQKRLRQGIWACARSISMRYHNITSPINDINPETDLVEEGILQRGLLLLKHARRTNAVITTAGKVELNLEIDLNGPLSFSHTLGFDRTMPHRPISKWERMMMSLDPGKK